MVPIQPYVLFCELIESLKYPLVWSIKQLTFSEYHVQARPWACATGAPAQGPQKCGAPIRLSCTTH